MFSSQTLPLFERLEIETQSHCNRSCWFCPRTYDTTGAYIAADGAPVMEQMPTDTVHKVLNEAHALGFRGLVSFYFYSEALLDKRNLAFAKLARSLGMSPYLHTNGDVLRNNDDLCAEVLNAYKSIIIGIYDYQSQLELDREIEFWNARLPGCDLKFSTIPDQPSVSSKSMAVPRALVPSDARFKAPDFIYDNAPCHRPLIRMILRYDGQMCFCCEDALADFDLGNIHESSLRELWFSSKHVDLMNRIVRGSRSELPLCQNCPLPPSAPPNDGLRIKVDERTRVSESSISR